MTTRVGRTLLAIGLLLILDLGCTPGEAPATPIAPPSVEPTATQVEPSRTATATSTATITPSLRPSRTPTPQPTNTPSPPPQIVRSYPIDGDQSIGSDRPLILEFDRPMNPDSVAAHLTISPTVRDSRYFRRGLEQAILPAL